MNKAFGRDTTYVSTIGLSQIAGAQMLHVFGPRKWINAGQAGPLGWTAPAALGVARNPDADVVALSGDYDFQFMIEELAVGAQFNLPYIHVVVNNSYLGLIRQSQRGFDMEQNVSLAFENINSRLRGASGYGVDHLKVAEGLGCKAVRVEDPNDLRAAFDKAKALMGEFQVPVVVEVILEKVTNISMGVEINAVNEFEELAEIRALTPPPPSWHCRPKPCAIVIAPDKFKGSLSAPGGRRGTSQPACSAEPAPDLDVSGFRSPTAARAPSTPPSPPASPPRADGQPGPPASRCRPTSRSADRRGRRRTGHGVRAGAPAGRGGPRRSSHRAPAAAPAS